DKKPARPGEVWTDAMAVYDLRTNKHFTLKQSPLRRADLDEFVSGYRRPEAQVGERWKTFTYDELIARDKAN
ncbi:SAM-dependent DNA methyltransferase, partial [Pseudomonas aeruginosa]